MSKKILIFLITIILGLGFVALKEVKAGPEENVYGWAWSENIGWISFNSDNCDVNRGEITNQSQCAGGSADYGVHIDPTGLFSGYAWSENIGWIWFAPTDTPPGETGPNPVSLNLTNRQISGWARALANGDGWDGWIKLRGTWADGVSLNTSPTPYEFEGWAWGSDVVGWVSFNRSNTGTASDYKVMTDIVINSPPIAVISCTPATCSVYETQVLVLNNNSTDPEGNIVKSEWSTKGQGQPDGSYVVRDTCIASPLCNFTPQNWLGIGNYTARLYVEDAGGFSDTATRNFSILRDISAGFMCSLDNAVWQVCEDVNPIGGDTVYFKDDSSLSEYSRASEGAAINSRDWKKDEDPPFDLGNNTNPSLTATIPSMAIKLTVTDSVGRTTSRTHTIGVRLPLPTWKEIPPF